MQIHLVIVLKRFSDISTVEMTNRNQNLLWIVPQVTQSLLGLYVFWLKSVNWKFVKRAIISAKHNREVEVVSEASQVEAPSDSAGWVG